MMCHGSFLMQLMAHAAAHQVAPAQGWEAVSGVSTRKTGDDDHGTTTPSAAKAAAAAAAVAAAAAASEYVLGKEMLEDVDWTERVLDPWTGLRYAMATIVRTPVPWRAGQKEEDDEDEERRRLRRFERRRLSFALSVMDEIVEE
jgi:hypothetical protein